MPEDQSSLDAAINAVQQFVAQLGTDLASAVTSLKNKLAGVTTTPPVDFTPEVTQLNAIGTTLQGLDAQAVAAGNYGAPAATATEPAGPVAGSAPGTAGG